MQELLHDSFINTHVSAGRYFFNDFQMLVTPFDKLHLSSYTWYFFLVKVSDFAIDSTLSFFLFMNSKN